MTPKVAIRFLTDVPEHSVTVADWLNKEWGAIRNESVEEALTLLRSNSKKAQIPFVLLALDGNTPVGTASLIPCDMPTRAELSPWLADVYVVESYRCRGIGRELIKAVEREADLLGVRKVYLFTTAATSLYDSLGWNKLERVEYRGEIVEIMAKVMGLSPVDGLSQTAYIHAKATLDYVYQLKLEATTRAQAIVTSSTLLLGALTIAATALAGKELNLQLGYPLFLCVMLSVGISLVLAFFAHLLVLRVYAPVVVDQSSSFEPLWLATTEETAIIERARGMDLDAATRDMIREARAVSRVQIIRAALVAKSVYCQIGAIVTLAIVVFVLGIAIVTDLSPSVGGSSKSAIVTTRPSDSNHSSGQAPPTESAPSRRAKEQVISPQ